MIGLEYIAADATGLNDLARRALSLRPDPFGAAGPRVPGRLEDIPEPIERFDPHQREQLSERLEQELSAYGPHVAVLDSIRALRQPGASLVLTGQQPGLLGGPLFNTWKALHAIRLARELQERWRAPVIPAFWNHADDHDLSEVNRAWIINPNLDVARVGLSSLSSGRRPVSDIVLRDEVHNIGAVRTALQQLHLDRPHLQLALDTLCPRNDETIGGAFTRSLTSMFGPFGLVVIEPGWIREDLSRSLARLVDPEGPGLLDLLSAGVEALARTGVSVSDPGIGRAALVYRVQGGSRVPLRSGGDGFRYDDEDGSRTSTELAAEIVQEPSQWSAGAYLRPLVQDDCLPVAAYIGGWGELAYQAILGPVRRGCRVPDTPFVPRLACTIVDAECRGALERSGLSILTTMKARGQLVEQHARRAVPLDVTQRLRQIVERAQQELLDERPVLAKIDRGLSMQLKRSADQLTSSVDKLCTRAERAHANIVGTRGRHLRRLDSTVFPRGAPQERSLTLFPYVARFGAQWVSEVLDEIDAIPCEHLVIHIDSAVGGHS